MMYNSNNNYDQNATAYSQLNLLGTGTTYLSFRDVPELIQKYCPNANPQVLDYGCGAGRSTRFLKHIGIQSVESVDVNPEMLKQATQLDPGGNYRQITSAETGSQAESFDLVFCSFVLVELSSNEEIQKIFKEVNRVLKKDGTFMLVTLSEDLFDSKHRWLSYDMDFAENRNLVSGSYTKFRLLDINLILQDYYWTNNDILTIGRSSDFESLEIHKTFGKKEDPFQWASEAHTSPYDIYIFRKSKHRGDE